MDEKLARQALETIETLKAEVAALRTELSKARTGGTGIEGALQSAVLRARPQNSPAGDAVIKQMLTPERAAIRKAARLKKERK